MSSFNLKSYVIGFEIPFFNQSINTDLPKLAAKLKDHYLNWFDVLKTEITFIELPSSNTMILYDLVVRVDRDLVNSDSLESEWDDVQSNIRLEFENFLNDKHIEFRTVQS